MDFAGRAIDDLGRGAEIDPHREHRALTHAHALGDFGARADERAVADDDRIGLERLEHAADAGPAREQDVHAALLTTYHGPPGIAHSALAHIRAPVDEAGHQPPPLADASPATPDRPAPPASSPLPHP